MANYYSIKNTKKYSPKQLASFLSKELKNRYNLDVETEILKESDCLVIKAKELNFTIWYYPTKFDLLENITTAFWKSGNIETKYHKLTKKWVPSFDPIFSFGISYAFLFEVITCIMCKEMNAKADFESVGKIDKLKNPNCVLKYSNMIDWSNDLIKKTNSAIRYKNISKSIKKSITESYAKFPQCQTIELKLFPELGPKK